MTAPIPRIAFFDFTGCEGCQLTVLDALQEEPALLQAVEIVQFREAMSSGRDDYQIAFVEGACTRRSDEARLEAIRERAVLVFALGACAHLGGIAALRGWQSTESVQRYVYGTAAAGDGVYHPRPISAVIEVDGALPGCPINGGEFVRCVKTLLQNRLPRLPDYPVCVECKLRANTCLFMQGKPCLGAITLAGCEAICPTFGLGCAGCRGWVPEPNDKWLEAAMLKRNGDKELLTARQRLFSSYYLLENEGLGHGNR